MSHKEILAPALYDDILLYLKISHAHGNYSVKKVIMITAQNRNLRPLALNHLQYYPEKPGLLVSPHGISVPFQLPSVNYISIEDKPVAIEAAYKVTYFPGLGESGAHMNVRKDYASVSCPVFHTEKITSCRVRDFSQRLPAGM